MGFDSLDAVLYTTGRRLRRAGLAADLTAVATVNIFTVAGGPVVLNGIAGAVTTVIGAAAGTTIQLNHTPVAPAAATVLCLASAAITNAVVGTVFTITGAVGVAMTVNANGIGIYQLTQRMVLLPGIMGLVVAVLANTGVIDWYVDYTPLTAAATVTAL